MTGQLPYGGVETLEVEVGGQVVQGRVAPPNARQPHAILLFDKKDAPRDDMGRPVFGLRMPDETPECASKKRRKKSDRPDAPEAFCGDEGRMANGRCKNHGGCSLKGPASPRYETGETSKYRIPSDMVARYKAFLTDPELHHHRSEIAQVDTLTDELWAEYRVGIGSELWERLQNVVGRLQIAERAGDVKKSRELFEALVYLVEEGAKHYSQGDRIVKYLGARRRHADSETKRKLSEAMVYSVEEAYQFYGQMGLAIRKHVSNPAERDAILNELAEIAGDAGATRGSRHAPP